MTASTDSQASPPEQFASTDAHLWNVWAILQAIDALSTAQCENQSTPQAEAIMRLAGQAIGELDQAQEALDRAAGR